MGSGMEPKEGGNAALPRLLGNGASGARAWDTARMSQSSCGGPLPACRQTHRSLPEPPWAPCRAARRMQNPAGSAATADAASCPATRIACGSSHCGVPNAQVAPPARGASASSAAPRLPQACQQPGGAQNPMWRLGCARRERETGGRGGEGAAESTAARVPGAGNGESRVRPASRQAAEREFGASGAPCQKRLGSTRLSLLQRTNATARLAPLLFSPFATPPLPAPLFHPGGIGEAHATSL